MYAVASLFPDPGYSSPSMLDRSAAMPSSVALKFCGVSIMTAQLDSAVGRSSILVRKTILSAPSSSRRTRIRLINCNGKLLWMVDFAQH